MTLSPAWAVDGGRVPASVARMLAWAATNGSNGVVQATDLAVTALPVPDGAVNVAPGGALMVNRFGGRAQAQTYVTANDATIQVTIPPTSSTPRTDYLILRVDDWHFDSSQQPENPLDATYCSLQRVTSLTGIAYPYVPLAKITIPASTGTITPAMITDLRQVANPRTKRVLRPNALIWSEKETLTVSTAQGEYWPNKGGTQEVFIPEWATRVKIRADWLAVLFPQGDVQGRVWVSFGDWDGKTWGKASQDFAFDNASNANASRTNIAMVDEMPVPANLRGRTVHFQAWAKKLSKVGPIIDGISGFVLDLTFEETADSSTT